MSGKTILGTGVLGGLLILVLGIILAILPKPAYAVIIGSAWGETTALFANDPEDICAIVNAVNLAIIRRG